MEQRLDFDLDGASGPSELYGAPTVLCCFTFFPERRECPGEFEELVEYLSNTSFGFDALAISGDSVACGIDLVVGQSKPSEPVFVDVLLCFAHRVSLAGDCTFRVCAETARNRAEVCGHCA